MNSCPICGANSNYAFTSEYHKINQCENPHCKHLFAVDVKPFQGVHEHEDDMKRDYEMYKERNEYLISYFSRKNLLKKNTRILDFGSGTGHILRSIKEKMPSVTVSSIEYNEEYHENLKSIDCNVYKTLSDIPKDEKFDLIFIIEVIEHLDNPNEVLQELKAHLSNSGKLFLSTPVGDLAVSLENRNKLSIYDLVYHVQFFTELSLRKALTIAGFTKITYNYIDELYPNRKYKSLNDLRRKIRRIIKSYIAFKKGQTIHMTFFAS